MLFWTVILTKKPALNVYRPSFFPRQFASKADARTCLTELHANGGDGTIERLSYMQLITDYPPKPIRLGELEEESK